ncbi:heat shock cognate 70 kDa protein [Trifolium repens]|nr:heat shock cognate 70 kDa protein [Trifolium repens]
MRDLIGKPYVFVKNFLDSMYLPFEAKEDSSRGTVNFVVDKNGTEYSPEELVAMVLTYAANLAEFHSKISIKDAVIAVPPYFGQAERRGLLQAAELAGINVLSLINEYSGAALQYGIDKDFSNESRHVVFYDMGSSQGCAWNPELGGQHMEMRLVEYFANEFNAQVGGGIDVRKFPKAMAKLKKQVKRTKEILSANTAAPISVESLHGDLDFRSSITREKFEELCEDIWEKSLLPLKELLEHSGLSTDQIYAVELIGGATRVPKLQIYKRLDWNTDAMVVGYEFKYCVLEWTVELVQTQYHLFLNYISITSSSIKIFDNQTQIFQEHSKEPDMLCAETLRLKDKLCLPW